MYKTTFGPRIQYVLTLTLIFLTLSAWTSGELYAQISITEDLTTNATCPDSSDGSISISVTGGTAPYSYSWTGPNYSKTGVSNISDLSGGDYTITVTDSSDPQQSESLDITIDDSDNINPIITAPGDITFQTDSDSCFKSNYNLGSESTSDNCGVASITNDAPAQLQLGETVITWTITDNSGNKATDTQTITIEDETAPNVITKNITVQLDASGNASIAEDAVDDGSTDACGGLTFDTDITSFDCSDVGSNSVNLTVTDANGNSANNTATVTVEDKTVPNIITKNITVQLDASGAVSITEDAINDGSTDACGGLTFDTDITSFDCSDVGSNSVNLTVTDANGNSANNTATVTVEDNIVPTVQVQNFTVQLDASGNANITPEDIDNGASDNCAVDNISLNKTAFDCSNVGVNNTVTLTVTDVNGNSASQTATITVEDNIVPTVQVQNFTVQLDASGNANITPEDIDNGSSDNCAVDNISLNKTAFDCSNVEVNNTVTLTVTDVNGNSASQTVTVTVEDNIVPTVQVQNFTVQLDASGNANITPEDIDNGSSDNCAVDNISLNKTAFDCSNVEVNNTVTLTVTDVNGNSASQTATITVEDNIVPTVQVQNFTVQLDASGNANITPEDIDNGSSDNCAVDNISLNKTAFDCSNVEVNNTVTLTVTDVNGNSASQTATVTVEDNILPEINPISTISMNSDEGKCDAILNIPNPGATDNCDDPEPKGTRDDGKALTEAFPVGTTLITWTVKDSSENSAESVIQEIIITDNELPVISHNSDQNVNNDPGTCEAFVEVNAIATDNCSVGSPSGKRDDDRALTESYPVGVTTITWTVTDVNGNNANEVYQTVTVVDNEKPSIPELPEIIAECSVTLTPPTTTDNCDEIVTAKTGVDLTFEESGSVIWIFTDKAGNSTEGVEQKIIIEDTQAPEPKQSTLSKKTITGCQISNISQLDIPTAIDACDGEIIGKLSDDFQFPYSFYGINTVTWQFIDDSGNITTQEQEIQLNPVSINGGSLTGTFNGTDFQNQIDISSCGAAISVDLVLSEQIGNIIQWEKFAVNEGYWEVISNTTQNYTTNFATGTLESTYYRALIQSGSCTEYSDIFYIRALPAGDAPTVTILDEDNRYCLGEDVNLLAESNYLATQPAIPTNAAPGDFNEGQLNTQDPDSWLTDGSPGGFTAGGNSKSARNWSGTNDHEFGNITYDGGDKKFAIAQGDFFATKNNGQPLYDGKIPTTLISPITDLSNAASASLEFDQAFYFANNDIALIEISIDGGESYTPLWALHSKGDGVMKWLTAGTAESTVGSDEENYNFSTDNTSISLDDYIGESEVRIRWSFTGTSDQSVWALDNIFIYNEVLVDTELEWTIGIGNPEENPIEQGATSIPLNFIPQSPGIHEYGATALINGCRTYDEEGTDLVELNVSYSYAGEDIIHSEANCGQNTVQLNAYDNTITANENATKGAYPNIPENCKTCDNPGTGDIGTWTWAGEISTCQEASFSNTNDPNATFTAGPGTYILTWTVDGCYNDLTVTITDCDQVDFDGNDDHVDFGNNYNLSGAFSIEVWIKPEVLSGTQTIFSKRESGFSGNAKGYDLKITDGIVSFNWDKSGSIVSPHELPTTDRWYHIALTHSSSGEYRLYIDGIEMKLVGGPSPGTNNYRAILGATDNIYSLTASKNFHGWMEELRIWKVALSKDQLHEMMNQRIDENNSKVRGEIIPIDIINLSWNNLIGYYRMDDISCGYLNPYSSIGPSGKLINITSSLQKTAPLPYISGNDGFWKDRASWRQPDVWTWPNDFGINGDPIDWNIVISTNKLKSKLANNSIYLLGLISEDGEIIIEGSNSDKSGQELNISHYLKLNGIINLDGESQLIQPMGSILDEDSSGYLYRDQQGTANSYNYNYWTSPVSLEDHLNNFGFYIGTVIKDGTNVDSPQEIIFESGYHFADGDYSGPKRISTSWLYIYHSIANKYIDWAQVTADEIIYAGEGFTMKGTSGAAPISSKQNYVFRGKPNNGTITLSIDSGENRLIGNPYPSAIDATEFIKDNLRDVNGGRNNKNIFNGALYFWDHFGKADSHHLVEYIGGYATYNLSGGVPAISNDYRINATGDSGSKVPGKYIPVAQGFFVNAVLDNDGGDITFKNSQRTFAKEDQLNGQSYFLIHNPNKKNPADYKKSKITKQAKYTQDTRYKIRLKFESPKGYHRQILVTADANTSSGFDLGYDAPLIENNVEDMYWMIDETEFVIQAVPDFNLDQVLKLGIKTAEPGEYKIKIDELENTPQGFNVYLKDLSTEEYYNISEEPFITTAEETGFFNDLYEIVFRKPWTEGPEEEKPEINLDDSLLDLQYLKDTDEISLLNPDLMQVDFVELYSISGQKVKTFKEVPKEKLVHLSIDQKLSSAVYIVKVFSGEKSYSKKVIITK